MSNTLKKFNSITNDSQNDIAYQHAVSYIREFSTQASVYLKQKSDESLVLLNRSSSLLHTTVQPQHFIPANVEIAKFFIDLHGLMNALDVDSDVMWTCVALLQHCSRNLEARQAIIDEYRFVPLLAFTLKRTQRHDRIQRLLVLLQDLTYGIRISWEDVYLSVLLEQLVQIIYGGADEQEEETTLIALSILVNLCYKNFVVLFLFLRSVNISVFSKRIQNYGWLANKMLIILSEDVHAFEQRELYAFLRSTFAAVDDSCKHWNVPHLRHIVDFLMDSKSHVGLQRAMLSYENYCEDIERLLEQIEARCSVEDSNEDTRRHQQICMGLIFKLIHYVLELSAIRLDGDKENIISLDSIVPRIYDLLCVWIESDVCGEDAVNLLDALLRLSKRETISPRIASDPTIITQLIAISEQVDTQPNQTTAILRLLLTLLQHTKTEKLILSRISESYFDKLMKPLLSLCPELTNKTDISQGEIEKCVFCLLLLINFASIAKKAYFEKCSTLLEQQQLQYALARAVHGSNTNVMAAVFEISKFENFPQASVAMHITSLNAAATLNATLPTPQYDITDQWRSMSATLKNHRAYVDKEIAARLNALIEIVSIAQRNGKLKEVPASQMIELYNYRIELFECAERRMQQRLEIASSQLTENMQRNNLQKAELQKYQTINFELHINQERLQTQCKDLKEQKDKLKSSTTELLKQLAEQSEALHKSEKRLVVKSSELVSYQKQCNELKAQLETKREELQKLDASNKENITRIEKLKKTINAYEQDIKEKVRTLEEKERDLNRTHKALDDQKEARKKCEDLVSALEAQLQEKKEQVQSLELELKETEEMRKTILCLMESKKPKRK